MKLKDMDMAELNAYYDACENVMTAYGNMLSLDVENADKMRDHRTTFSKLSVLRDKIIGEMKRKLDNVDISK